MTWYRFTKPFPKRLSALSIPIHSSKYLPRYIPSTCLTLFQSAPFQNFPGSSARPCPRPLIGGTSGARCGKWTGQPGYSSQPPIGRCLAAGGGAGGHVIIRSRAWLRGGLFAVDSCQLDRRRGFGDFCVICHFAWPFARPPSILVRWELGGPVLCLLCDTATICCTVYSVGMWL